MQLGLKVRADRCNPFHIRLVYESANLGKFGILFLEFLILSLIDNTSDSYLEICSMLNQTCLLSITYLC